MIYKIRTHSNVELRINVSLRNIILTCKRDVVVYGPTKHAIFLSRYWSENKIAREQRKKIRAKELKIFAFNKRRRGKNLQISPEAGACFVTVSHLSPVHRPPCDDELLIFRFARRSDQRRNYSRAAGRFNPRRTATTATTGDGRVAEFGRKNARCEPTP